jgi:hypothetical protein
MISAIATGSLAPDSPCRIVPLRPPTSRLPSTENMTAGSVGASAAPMMAAVVQSRSSSRCAPPATIAPVTSVPGTPRMPIGHTDSRNRPQPTSIPPSNRITISATVPISPTSTGVSSPASVDERSDAIAAPARNSTGAGTRSRSATGYDKTASSRPPEANNTMRAKSDSSPNGRLPGDGRGSTRCGRLP